MATQILIKYKNKYWLKISNWLSDGGFRRIRINKDSSSSLQGCISQITEWVAIEKLYDVYCGKIRMDNT